MMNDMFGINDFAPLALKADSVINPEQHSGLLIIAPLALFSANE